MPLMMAKVCPESAFEKTIYRARELTANFSKNMIVLFADRANDFLDNVDRFFLSFVVDTHHHLSQQAHSDKLDADYNQERAQKQ